MNRSDLALHDEIVLRTKIIGKISSFTERKVEVDIGPRKIMVHHSDILKKYNGGRDNEKDKQLENELDRHTS